MRRRAQRIAFGELEGSLPLGNKKVWLLEPKICYNESMSKTQTIDVSTVSLSSLVFPTKHDMAVWNELTPAQREAFIVETEARGAKSGIAPEESLEARLARVRARGDAG